MPYPANHRVEKKRAIIDSARKLFNRSGFDNVSSQEIMAGAGLTHGGFYIYFKSKSDLYAEVLGCFFTIPTGRVAGRASKWICRPPTLARKSCAPICRDNTSKT
jgi:AcrR family transcriptional regulator